MIAYEVSIYSILHHVVIRIYNDCRDNGRNQTSIFNTVTKSPFHPPSPDIVMMKCSDLHLPHLLHCLATHVPRPCRLEMGKALFEGSVLGVRGIKLLLEAGVLDAKFREHLGHAVLRLGQFGDLEIEM